VRSIAFAWRLYKRPTEALCVQKIGELVEGDGSVIAVNDKKLLAPLRVKLKFVNASAQQ